MSTSTTDSTTADPTGTGADPGRSRGLLRRLTAGRTSTVLAATAAAALALTGCGGDDDDTEGEESPAATEPASPTEDDSPADGEAEAEAVTVTAVDYSFQGVPDTVEAGTQLRLENDSSGEVHEILAVPLPEDEDRSVEELLQLPPEEQPEIRPVGVALAAPGGSSEEFPTPPLTLEEPGRYALICGLPVDGPPEEVLQAARDFVESGDTEGGPDYPDTGPPHFTQGMFAEVVVEG